MPIDFDNDENPFAVLAQKTIADAEAIECSIDDFVEGLRLLASMLEDRADAG